MKHRMNSLTGILIAMVMVFLSVPQGRCEGEIVLRFEGSDSHSAAYQTFINKHPEVTAETVSNIYLSTDEIISALLSGEFQYDTFGMTSSSFDVQKMIAKGYCAPLSGSPSIKEGLSQMYTPIQEIVQSQGDIYGLPFMCYIGYFGYYPDGWEAAGLDADQVPTTFLELLDFLEAWVERIKDEPESNISICNTFDSDFYNQYSYTSYLVDLLLKYYIMQWDYEGKPLQFNTQELRDTLKRCQEIGEALYTYEPIEKGEYQLFGELHGMRSLKYLIPLRLTREEPVLIKGTVYMRFVNIRSSYPELSTEYLEDTLASIQPEDAAYLYRDAEPVEDPSYAEAIAALEKQISETEAALLAMAESDKAEARQNLEDQLESRKRSLAQLSNAEERYIVSQEDLEMYRQYGDCLYFQAPGVFDPSTPDGVNMKHLRDRFCTGQLPLEQFIQRLDELAWMLETESE